MSNKFKFSVYRTELEGAEVGNINPSEDVDAVTWQQAKKQLRQWYLLQAKLLRSVDKKSYFKQ